MDLPAQLVASAPASRRGGARGSRADLRIRARAGARGVDLSVRAGEFVALVGPNGSGKSTLVRLLLGSLEPASGEAMLFGRSPTAPRRRGGRLGYVPQRPNLSSELPATVQEIVTAGRLTEGRWWMPTSREDRRQVDARHRVRRARRPSPGTPVNELSGGQQQRAFIARAFASEPSLLVLDEPTAGVDAASQRSLPRLDRAPDPGARRRGAARLPRTVGRGRRRRPRRRAEAARALRRPSIGPGGRAASAASACTPRTSRSGWSSCRDRASSRCRIRSTSRSCSGRWSRAWPSGRSRPSIGVFLVQKRLSLDRRRHRARGVRGGRGRAARRLGAAVDGPGVRDRRVARRRVVPGAAAGLRRRRARDPLLFGHRARRGADLARRRVVRSRVHLPVRPAAHRAAGRGLGDRRARARHRRGGRRAAAGAVLGRHRRGLVARRRPAGRCAQLRCWPCSRPSPWSRRCRSSASCSSPR